MMESLILCLAAASIFALFGLAVFIFSVFFSKINDDIDNLNTKEYDCTSNEQKCKTGGDQ